MDAKRLPNAFKNNLKTHLKNDVFLVRKMQISKSLQIAPKVPFGKGICAEEPQHNKPLPYEAQHASGAERPGADFCDFGGGWGSTFSDNFENAQKKVQQNDALRFEVPEGPPMQRVVAGSVA